MKIVYDGPQPSRTVEVGGGKQVTVERGKSFDAPEGIGKRLIEQRYFSTPGNKGGEPTKQASGTAGGQKEK